MPGGTFREGYCALSFVPATSSLQSWTLEGLFELTQRPSRALNSLRALLLEPQRDKDTIKSTRRRVPRTRTPSKTVDVDLIIRCVLSVKPTNKRKRAVANIIMS